MRIFIFIILLTIGLNIYGQKRSITGIIIDEYLEPVVGARIMDADSLILRISDNTGKFIIDISPERNRILIAAVGFEWKSIIIPINCNHLEVLLLAQNSYDFLPLKKVNKLRKKRFKKLPKLYKAAYEKKIFISEKPCYEERFIPINW